MVVNIFRELSKLIDARKIFLTSWAHVSHPITEQYYVANCFYVIIQEPVEEVPLLFMGLWLTPETEWLFYW